MSINVVADVAIHIPLYVAIAVAIPLLLYYRSAEGITSLLPLSPSNALHCYRSVYNIILQCQLIVCCCCWVSYLSTTRGSATVLPYFSCCSCHDIYSVILLLLPWNFVSCCCCCISCLRRISTATWLFMSYKQGKYVEKRRQRSLFGTDCKDVHKKTFLHSNVSSKWLEWHLTTSTQPCSDDICLLFCLHPSSMASA